MGQHCAAKTIAEFNDAWAEKLKKIKLSHTYFLQFFIKRATLTHNRSSTTLRDFSYTGTRAPLTIVLVSLSLIMSSKTSLKLFTKVVRQPGLKSELGSNSSTSTESKLSWELRSSSYNVRNSSCASLISFFNCKRDQKENFLT